MLYNYFHRLSQNKHCFWIAAAIGICLVLPSLGAGFFADDFTQFILINEGNIVKQPNNISLFHLFSFIDSNPERRTQLLGFSITPWWVSQNFSLLFFRPLSEITHYIDYQWLKPNIWLMHLHSLIWYGFLLAALVYFYKIFCSTHKVALLAFLFFVMDSTHGFTVAWLANRNAIIAATFCVLAIIYHHRFRESQKKYDYIFSFLCIAGSFLSAEAGIVVGCFLFSYAIFVDKDGAIKGLTYLLPALCIFIIWFGLYKTYGYGAFGNKAYYIDPIESPTLFLSNLPSRLLHTLSMQFNLLPIHLYKPLPIFNILLGAGLLIVFISVFIFQTLARYRFFTCAMLLAIIPITSSELQDRNMLFVGIAAAAILAEFVRYLYQQQHLIYRITLVSIIFFHLFISGLMMLPISYAPKLLAQSSIATAKSLPNNINNDYIVALGIPVFDASYLAAIRRTEHLTLPKQFWHLSTQISGLSIERIDSHHFILYNPKGLLGGIDFMLRDMSFDPIFTNETVDLNGLRLTIIELNKKGTPIKINVTINKNIPEQHIKIYALKNRQLTPLILEPGNIKTF
jgi:hypothetical protein